MLKQRILTALVLIPTFVSIILWAPMSVVTAIAMLTGVLAAFEWAKLYGLSSLQKILFFLLLSLGVGGLYQFEHRLCLAQVSLIFWALATALVLFYRPNRYALLTHKWVGAFMGLILVGSYTVSVTVVVEHSRALLIALLVFVWSADTGAYFAGKALGKHKLIPFVSPNKTWEGTIGGFVLSMVVLALAWQFKALLALEDVLTQPLVIIASAGGCLFVLAVFGDLFESMIKRIQGCKDSGGLLPGHGGVLDRLDSLIATVPLLAVFLGM